MTMTNMEAVVHDRTWLRSTANSTAAAEARNVLSCSMLCRFFCIYFMISIRHGEGRWLEITHVCHVSSVDCIGLDDCFVCQRARIRDSANCRDSKFLSGSCIPLARSARYIFLLVHQLCSAKRSP